jgi:photosynthetic reaction center cytochrome c subunit
MKLELLHVPGLKRFTRLGACAGLVLTLCLAGCEPPPVDSVQRGYRGLGMVELYSRKGLEREAALNVVPDPIAPATPGTPPATTAFKNLQVLNDLSISEMSRVMVAMTQWVAPAQGCTYCHDAANFASDTLYTKVVARRMLQMTRHINADWKTHVANTGVTCYTCHRGQPVPSQIWFKSPTPHQSAGQLGDHGGMNLPTNPIGLASLPYDPFTTFYDASPAEIRVNGDTALPEGNRHSIKQTEWTYALMMNISQSLGVNCTYCHNTRSFAIWDSSTPQRNTAWYGIRMVRDLNTAYLDPLASTFPANRLGPTGDGPKLYCATCHQGAYKPFFGASMLKDYPELSGEHTPGLAATAATAAPEKTD